MGTSSRTFEFALIRGLFLTAPCLFFFVMRSASFSIAVRYLLLLFDGAIDVLLDVTALLEAGVCPLHFAFSSTIFLRHATSSSS
jgi:hypothetical protein